MKRIFILFCFFINLNGDIVLDIVSNQEALPKLKVLSSGQIDKDFDNIIKNDIKVASKFELVDTNNADYFLTYTLKNTNSTYEVDLVLSSSNGKKEYLKNFKSDNLIFLSHKSIVDMHNELKLANIDWMNKKILITKKVGPKHSQIIISDYTLKYQKIILDSGLNLFAKWANREQNAFYYTDYNNDDLIIYKYNLLNGKKEVITKGMGMLAVSDVNFTNNSILLTKTVADQPEIFIFDLLSKKEIRLTNYKGIDVGAKFFGNNDIVFISDRGSYPNLYLQNIKSQSFDQLVFHGKNNSAFDVFNEFIVYSSREIEGDFNLYLMSKNHRFVRQITLNGKNIFPNFSHDGKTIMFIKVLGNQTSLGIVRLDENQIFHFPMTVGRISTLDW